ncbi:MAG: insulinase family protein [Bacteroidales bacterium]
MKKLFLLILVGAMGLQVFGQGPLPIDPKTVKGTLPNGLTYYIRANAEPKGQAEFFIAQKVGSMQELENQRGLAHFLEHMAFNGTKNFPGKALFTFTEGIGVKFGYNLNAGTSWDETVYNISAVPVSRKGIVDSCLLVLHDWSNALTLLDKDINEERGVIREEMRTRDDADMRMLEKMLTLIFPNNRYSERFVIGTKEVIENFKPQELRDYYHRWYRPDHQAIIIIGDIDPVYVESKIKTMFSDIAKPSTPSELVAVPIADNATPIVGFITDPEATNSTISINYKQEALPKELKLSAQSLVLNYVKGVIGEMLNSRFEEIGQTATPPFMYAYSYYAPLIIAKTADAFTTTAMFKEGGVQAAYESIITELARVKQHGFTAGEYDRARAEFLSNYEKSYNERDKRKSGDFAQECVRNFIDDEIMPGIETEYTLINQMAPMLTVEQINQMAQGLISEENLIIYGTGPAKEGLTYPSNEELLATYNKVFNQTYEAYKEEVSNEPLIAKLPKPGKIKKTSTDKTFGATVYTLSNGIKVVVKPTDFKSDEIQFTSTSLGGTSLYGDADILNLKVLNSVATIGGVGNFSQVNLTKALSGKRASVNANISLKDEGLSGSCSPKDLETMMQLIYLYATSPRADEEAYASWTTRQKAFLESMDANPMSAFSDTLTVQMYGQNQRARSLKLNDLAKIDYKRIIEIYKERFQNMNDFIFTFVGNIDEATFKPLMEQYIATLPSAKGSETFKDVKMYTLTGERLSHFDKEMQSAKATACAVYTGKVDYTPANVLKMDILKQVLDIVYTEEIREKEGGTYGVGVQLGVDDYPYGNNYKLLIFFDTESKMAEKLLSIVYREFKDLSVEGPRAQDLDKIKAFLLKDIQEKTRDNESWMHAIDQQYTYNHNLFLGKEALVNSITAEDIKEMAKLILSQTNRSEIIMKGFTATK